MQWPVVPDGDAYSPVIDRLDATTTDDGDLDRVLEQLPDRLANIGRLEADCFIPPLARPSGRNVATDDDDLDPLDTP